jgi:putative SOS response-associated peptidase YedK
LKRPYFIRARGGEPMAFAAIWETWADTDGGEVDTAAIITCAANAVLAPIHARMPVVIPPGDFDRWLDPDETKFKEACELLTPAPDDFMEAHEVSPRVNKAANDDAENIVPVADINSRAA